MHKYTVIMHKIHENQEKTHVIVHKHTITCMFIE